MLEVAKLERLIDQVLDLYAQQRRNSKLLAQVTNPQVFVNAS